MNMYSTCISNTDQNCTLRTNTMHQCIIHVFLRLKEFNQQLATQVHVKIFFITHVVYMKAKCLN